MVGILHSYIADRFCGGQGERVFTDSVSSESRTRPPSIEGYVPDVYVMLNELGGVVIGEAKSMRDLENSHTEAQVTAFLRRCGMADGSAFILAVPWPVERLASALLTNFRAREGLPHVEIVVLSEANRMGTAATVRKVDSLQKVTLKREPDLTLKHEAFAYQLEAVNAVKDLEYAAIFHEQGLGKTKVAIDLIVYWLSHRLLDTALIVVKKGLLDNWQRELASHSQLIPRVLTNNRGGNFYVFNSPARVMLAHYEAVKAEKERMQSISKD